jgi:membrane-bound serine protease (ClpP class)
MHIEAAMRCWALILMAGLTCGLGTSLPTADVGLIKVNGAIGPATLSYVVRGVDVASARDSACLIIQLDTPGGLVDSTKDIVAKLYQSKVPTVVYVSPAPARAASAGVFITMAADIAAMAPHTHIGAAHPVGIGIGGEIEKTDDVMKKKEENDIAAFAESIAEKRNRNADWAKSAVLESVSITAEKALELKVIDLIAKDLPDLLEQMDGREVNGQALHTAKANIVEIPMNFRESFLHVVLRPEVMFILMLMVIYGIIGELSSPGAILPGVAGAIALILVLCMSAILPINAAGLALIGVAIALFIADIFAPTHGVLTTGGIIAFFLGALMLFNRSDAGFRLSLAYIIPATLVTATFFAFVVGKGLRAQFLPVRSGKETMLGKTAPALAHIDAGSGKVFVEGEYWNATSDVPIEPGQPVVITAVVGLTLKVKPQQS